MGQPGPRCFTTTCGKPWFCHRAGCGIGYDTALVKNNPYDLVRAEGRSPGPLHMMSGTQAMIALAVVNLTLAVAALTLSALGAAEAVQPTAAPSPPVLGWSRRRAGRAGEAVA